MKTIKELDKKIIAAIIVFLAMIVLLFVLEVWPAFNAIKQSSEKLFLARREIAFVQTKSRQTAGLEQTLKSLGPDIFKVREAFIDPEMPVGLLHFLENTAIESNVLLDVSFRPQQGAEKTTLSFLAIQLSFNGSFTNCLKFLERIETSAYLTEIENLSIRRISEAQIKSAEYKGLLAGDAEATLLLKVFTK